MKQFQTPFSIKISKTVIRLRFINYYLLLYYWHNTFSNGPWRPVVSICAVNFGVLGFNVNVNLSHFYEHIKPFMTWETKLNKSCIKLWLRNNKIRQLLKCSFYQKQEFVSQTNILSAMKSTYKIALNARTGLIMLTLYHHLFIIKILVSDKTIGFRQIFSCYSACVDT